MVQWAPNGRSSILVYENDIYYEQDGGRIGRNKRLTFDGQHNTIYNGIPDWLYEEEILYSNKAFWFSDDGRKMVYASFNDSQVGKVRFTNYAGSYDAKQAFQYPQLESIRYPKVYFN